MGIVLTVPFYEAKSASLSSIGQTTRGSRNSRSQQSAAQQKGAEVQAVSGTATYQVAGGPVVEIKAGDVIPEGAVVNTSPGSSVDVFLGRNVGVLRVTESSTLQIATLQQVDSGSGLITQTKLVLQKGEVLGDVNKQSAGSSFSITLPDGEVNTTQGRFQISNRALDNLAENGGKSASGGSTQSTVRFTDGQGSFSKAGQVFSFNGAGEYTPGSNDVAPLAPEAKQLLAQQFEAIKSDSGKGSSEPGGQFVGVNQNPVQPQETPLSPTTGNPN